MIERALCRIRTGKSKGGVVSGVLQGIVEDEKKYGGGDYKIWELRGSPVAKKTNVPVFALAVAIDTWKAVCTPRGNFRN